MSMNLNKSKLRLLESLRKKGTLYLRKHSRISREVIERPGGWRSLDLIYGNDPDCLNGDRAFVPRNYFDRMFFYSAAAEATRNRLNEFEQILRRLINNYSDGMIEILSIASGPGREIIKLLCETENDNIRATCIDLDSGAINLGKGLAEARCVSDRIVFKRGNAKKVDEYEEKNKYHIIITKEFLDYLTCDASIEFLTKVKKITKPGGTIVVCNMDRHRWIKFWMEAEL